jgi:hypothetical protein
MALLMLACLSLSPPHAGAKVTRPVLPIAPDPNAGAAAAYRLERRSKERREGAAALDPTIF